MNQNDSILANYNLGVNYNDGQCTADVVMKAFIGIITNKEFKSKIVGILGELPLLIDVQSIWLYKLVLLSILSTQTTSKTTRIFLFLGLILGLIGFPSL